MTTALITGATGIIGKAIAKKIASIPGYELVLVARNSAKADPLIDELRRSTNNPKIHLELADLSLGKEIEALAQRWRGPLHVLVNNAGETPRRKQETTEGVERQFATNVLGYYRMIQALVPALAASAPSRIVNVASYWAGNLDLNDPEFRSRSYNNDSAYRQSKQADRMLSAAFAKRLAPQGINVYACHPGDVPSTLARNLGFGGSDTPEQAASTPVWLATEAIGNLKSGSYYEHLREVHCRFAEDRAAVEALMALCANYQ